jgi:hypothetical protein
MRLLNRRYLRLILAIAIVLVSACGLFAPAASAAPSCPPGQHAVCTWWFLWWCLGGWECQDDPPTIVSEAPSPLIYVLGAALIVIAFFVVARLRAKRHQPAGS